MSVCLDKKYTAFKRPTAVVIRFVLLSLVFIPLWSAQSGCTSSRIYDDRRFNPPVYFGRHKVSAGDTLYSIAWRYGRDFRELASANNIHAPYVIRPGQIIRLDLRGNTGETKAVATVVKPPKKNKPAPSATVKKEVASPQSSHRKGNVDWHWPHAGPLIAVYSVKSESVNANVNKGVDISGNLGDAVYAAAEGEVVYAGSGLLGYGKLVIINHNQHYLSAYAHCDEILVKEGQTIKSGQVIAKMGASGSDRVKLHFEIRKDGKPVNPLRYLPSRTRKNNNTR